MATQSSIFMPAWRERSGLIIAQHFQRMYRGWKIREILLFDRWIEMNHAASIIQKAFRSNRQKMENKYFIDAYLFAKHKKQKLALQRNRNVSKNGANTSNNIERIFNNECSYDENIAFWRAIVELRRAYRQYSTDVLIKALIECNHDLTAAIKTLGNIQFSIRNDSNLSTENRLRFLPESIKIEPAVLYQSSSSSATRRTGTASNQLQTRTNTAGNNRQNNYSPSSSPYRSGTAGAGSSSAYDSLNGDSSSPSNNNSRQNNRNSYNNKAYISSSNNEYTALQVDVLRILMQAYFSTKQKQTKSSLKSSVH